MARPGLALACGVSVALSACHSLGPSSIRAGRARYEEAIRETGEQQMLLNLVRLQYDDLPFFLQVTSVNAEMQVMASVGLKGGYETSSWELVGNVGASVTEHPTVVYQPVQGEEFGRLLLTRVQDSSLGLLFHGNQKVSLLFKLFVHDFGRLHNQPIKAPTSPEQAAEYEEFKRVITSLDMLADHGTVDLDSEPLPLQALRRYEERRKVVKKEPPDNSAATPSPEGKKKDGGDDEDKDKDKGKSNRWDVNIDWPVLRLRRTEPPEDLAAWCRIITQVGAVTASDGQTVRCPGGGDVARYYFLTPSHLEDEQFDVVSHIPVTTRTLLEVMTTASGGVSIPEGRAHGRPTATCDDRERNVEAMNEFFHVYCSTRAPRDAAVRVPWRGRWYFIRSDDSQSRQVFSLMRLMFQVQLSRNALSFGPILTLPVSH